MSEAMERAVKRAKWLFNLNLAILTANAVAATHILLQGQAGLASIPFICVLVMMFKIFYADPAEAGRHMDKLHLIEFGHWPNLERCGHRCNMRCRFCTVNWDGWFEPRWWKKSDPFATEPDPFRESIRTVVEEQKRKKSFQTRFGRLLAIRRGCRQ